MEQETWICIDRARDDVSLAWMPASWPAEDRTGFGVAVTTAGILVGEVYLHEIPEWVLESAKDAWEQLKLGNYGTVLSKATHRRTRHGNKWFIVPVNAEMINV